MSKTFIDLFEYLNCYNQELETNRDGSCIQCGADKDRVVNILGCPDCEMYTEDCRCNKEKY